LKWYAISVARFHPPANVQLRRAQIVLILATLLPTIMLIATGIVLLAIGNDTSSLVAGVLVLAFCTTSLTGYILGSIFMRKGAQIARFQNDFLSSVSHELRTPLTSISMFIATLGDERMTDPKRKAQCLSILDQEVARLQGLVETLLSLSHMESGRRLFEKKPLSVQSLLEKSLVAFRAATLHDPTDIVVEQETNLWLCGDTQTLEQAVGNLLLNAWKYTPSQTRNISLQVCASKRFIEITVADNGAGIPHEEQKRIFYEFERGDKTNEKSGHGLGLAIVRAIVRAHHGKITLRSHVGAGAQFCMRLPRFIPAKNQS